ncbi:MAG TPA: HAD-IB family hydrolase [Ilumatobacteraceae bacterium]|jgi:putative phosphoserine phosphatase/1-acylglycerol-3-phosphate O-acyltransferase
MAAKTKQPSAPPRGAAFFDLDRTLLAGASGEVFSAAMRTAGLVTRTVPGERLLFSVFNAVGETLPSMALARQAVAMAKGRPQAAVQSAAQSVAGQLVAMVQPLAGPLFDEHRESGRPIVLATTTPYDLVKPFADLLGLDDVVATRYGLNADGTYDGTLHGPFVWSAGKLAAVREWAQRHDIDLAHSFAYSDSFFDAPLLAAVGHPFAVNPDPRMAVLARTRRWPIIRLDEPSPAGKLPVIGLDLQKLAMALTRPQLVPYARFEITGVENIPAAGPAILCGNHRSYFDPMAMAMMIAKTGRTVRFLGKKEVFDAPVVGQLAAALGGIRVERGSGSDGPLQAAADALEAGDLVAIMPQGTIPRGIEFFDPVLKGRWGAARLAALTKAPIIPIGLWGTEKVWPRNARLPNMLNLANPPTVSINVGAPVALKYRSADADTKALMKAISALLPGEARVARTPTDDELAATLPSGYTGDPRANYERRPGTD